MAGILKTRIILCAAFMGTIMVTHAVRAEARNVEGSVMTADTAKPCPPIAPEVIKTGRKIFSSTANCYACHGADAKGTPLAPDLTDKTWLQIDGSYEAIVKLIHSGVPKPKSHPAPMPPLGGSALSDEQVCAVGAYVYSLSHKAP